MRAAELLKPPGESSLPFVKGTCKEGNEGRESGVNASRTTGMGRRVHPTRGSSGKEIPLLCICVPGIFATAPWPDVFPIRVAGNWPEKDKSHKPKKVCDFIW